MGFHEWLRNQRQISYSEAKKEYPIIFVDTSAIGLPGNTWRKKVLDCAFNDFNKEQEAIHKEVEELEKLYSELILSSNTVTVRGVINEKQYFVTNINKRLKIITDRLHSKTLSNSLRKKIPKLQRAYNTLLATYENIMASLSEYEGEFFDLIRPLPVSETDKDLAAAAYAQFTDNDMTKIGILTRDQDISDLLAVYLQETALGQRKEFSDRVHSLQVDREVSDTVYVIRPNKYLETASYLKKDYLTTRTSSFA